MKPKTSKGRVGYDPRPIHPSMKKPPPWALKGKVAPTDLPAIFSGPDSDLLWKAIAELGEDDLSAMDVYNAVYQLACSVQALEVRLMAALKKNNA